LLGLKGVLILILPAAIVSVILFIKKIVLSKDNKSAIVNQFGINSKNIIRDIYECIADAIAEVDSVEILYDYNLEKVSLLATETVSYMGRDIDNYKQYLNNKDQMKIKLRKKILQIFE